MQHLAHALERQARLGADIPAARVGGVFGERAGEIDEAVSLDGGAVGTFRGRPERDDLF